MPPKGKTKGKDAEEATPRKSLTLTLADKTLTVPRLDGLTLGETFAILNATGTKAEVFWTVRTDQPLGRATVTVWWWIARSREAGVLLPLGLIDDELVAAAEEGKDLVQGLRDDEDSAPEG